MKSFGTRYVARHTRTAVMPSVSKNQRVLIKKLLTWAVLLGLFAVSVNKIVEYAVKNMPKFSMSIAVPDINLFSEDKYIIEEGGKTFVVSSNGKIRQDDGSRDGKYLVRLIGVWTDEKRPEYKKAFKEALKIDKKYFTDVSEINVRNLQNVLVVTADGATASFGDSVNNEKMENFSLALDEIKESGKRFKTMNLMYEDMVIIK